MSLFELLKDFLRQAGYYLYNDICTKSPYNNSVGLNFEGNAVTITYLDDYHRPVDPKHRYWKAGFLKTESLNEAVAFIAVAFIEGAYS
jgi:hypothetical protein